MSVMKEERAWWLAFGAESGSTAAVMLTEGNIDVAGVARRIVNGLMLAVWLVACLHAQDATYPAPKPSPPKIEGQIVLLPESVVETQWPHALKLMNAPQSVRLLNPGQCIRVGIYSTGDKRDEFLEKSRLSFRTQFAGHSDVHGLASPADFKKIKPEGGDFVAAALGAAGLKTPEAMKSMASLAVSADHWCVPADAADGIATVEVEVESPGGHQT